MYFKHPSTDILVDISVDISTDSQPMHRSTYRPSVGRYVGLSIEWWSICRPTYPPMHQPRYRPSDGRRIDRLSTDISVDIAADTRPIRRPLIVGGISVNCRWYIGQKLRLSVYKLYAFHLFSSTSRISEGFMFGLHVLQTQSLSSKTLK